MATLKPRVVQIAFYSASLVASGFLIYYMALFGPAFPLLFSTVADFLSIITFAVFSGPTISDIIRRKRQEEATKADVAIFVQGATDIFRQIFPVFASKFGDIQELSKRIKLVFCQKCEKGEFERLDFQVKLRIIDQLVDEILSEYPNMEEEGVRKFFSFTILKKIGEGDIVQSVVNALDEKSMFITTSWQYSFCRCSLLFHKGQLDADRIPNQFESMPVEEVKEHYYFLRNNLEMYKILVKLQENSRYKEFYEALKDQLSEMFHKSEISHVALRTAIASEKTDLVCVIKWAEAGRDVLGTKFEKLGWATPATTKTIQISPISKTPVVKDFDLNKWIEDEFQLCEIDTPYRLVAIRFNIKDMQVKAYKRSDEFLRVVSEGFSAKRIEELVFSEAESLKDLIDWSDLALLVPSFSNEVKRNIREKDRIIRAQLVKEGFQPIKSPLDFMQYRDRTKAIENALVKSFDNKQQIGEVEMKKIAQAFVENSEKLAELVESRH
jgi:hypothetical protein